ncbi:MAG: metallophosphoesterase [Armatimonadetes bacterium]|nr:metallophosphoesterase [Armatimonadota bacterium]
MGKAREDPPKGKNRRLSRRRWLLGCGGGAAAVAAAIAVGGDQRKLTVSRIDLRLPRLGRDLDGFTIAHLTDLHRGLYVPASFIRRAVAETNALRPDLVVLTGDYVSRSAYYLASCAEALGELSAPRGTLAVFGNHEHWTDVDAARWHLSHAGRCDVLENESITFMEGSATLCVVGLDDPWTHHERFHRAFRNVPAGAPVVLLSHTPDIAAEAARRKVDLVLCGHTHGGEVVLPGIGPPYIWARTGRRFASGLNYEGGTAVYTNRGIGVGPLPFRLNCPPEIALFTLRASGEGP